MRTGEASWSIISEVSALRLPHRALDIELSGTSPRGAAMDRFCTNWAPLEWRGAAAKDKAFRMAWTRSEEVDVLLERVESSGDDEARPLLERLAELTTPGTEAWGLANRELARLTLDKEPWRASVLAKRVVAYDSADHLAWGVLALAQSLLGNYEFAAAAYQRARSLAPENPWYLHNLGHLLDALLDRPMQAIPLLRRALIRLPGDPHVLASLAHALARAGFTEEAREVMLPVMRKSALDEHHVLYRWLLEQSDRAVALHLERNGAAPGERRPRKSRRTRA